MLKQRVITAIVIFSIFCVTLFLAPPFVFAYFVGFVCLVSAWEWGNLSSLKNYLSRGLYVVFVALIGFAGWFFHEQGLLPITGLLIAVALWWAVALLWVQSYPASTVLWGPSAIKLIMGLFVILPTWMSFSVLRYQPQGHLLVLSVVLVVAAADIGAYFSGRAFGKRKLAPAISPGKSWEGVVGGVIGAMLVAYCFAVLVGSSSHWLPMLIAIPTALVSVLGDLFESMLKRHRGIKDSSNILPGHGGLLDRVDGLVAAVPIFTLGVLVSGWQVVSA